MAVMTPESSSETSPAGQAPPPAVTRRNSRPAKPRSLRRRLLRGTAWAAGLVTLAVAVFLAIPSPIHPLAWNPPPAPALTGVLAPNEKLSHAQLVSAAPDGPEFITFDAQGDLYTGDESGTIYRIPPGGKAERFANTAGRPNGLAFAPNGNLLVADTRRGLLSVSPAGQVTVLASKADGRPIALANELVRALSDSTGHIFGLTTALAHDGYLYLGTDHTGSNDVMRYPLSGH